MVTWTEYQGEIKIQFGFDVNMGYFIIIYDMRLAAHSSDGTEFDDVCYAVSEDGTGANFSAYTKTSTQGHHVGVDTMRKLWRAYSVYEKGKRGLKVAGVRGLEDLHGIEDRM
ncbi:hypothetical protein BDV26DRAFT_291840 [Aspergillus bertholletiae]|uniref:Uncharacterized protein n=1 Tax=Aspergillus bertholletiae TaxID=1226010 RepID=A0A5N7BAT5_9EURO|nr:hypothetical protein BDV26DRAFT_291840 [Aspergillus bertholletiae]